MPKYLFFNDYSEGAHPRVLDAMARVPRQLFVPPDHRGMAYADGPLPIGEGQTISQPYIVALMTQMLDLKGYERVLEVGTGSGYQAAILSLLANEVHTVERFPDLAERAVRVFDYLHIRNIYVHVGDGSLGWAANAPYEAVVVTAAAPRAPQPLLDQLSEGGRLVIPVGGYGDQYLEAWERKGDEFTHEGKVPVAFVPLRGQYGWDEGYW